MWGPGESLENPSAFDGTSTLLPGSPQRRNGNFDQVVWFTLSYQGFRVAYYYY